MVRVLEKSRIVSRFVTRMSKDVRNMSLGELRAEFEVRKRALLEVRDEIDRRERKPAANVEFTNYIGDGIEN